ncbi:MAG: flippase [Ignavibacteriae bacterium]|nr:flippase [Ignavibacteriota bacterium]
MPTQTKKITLDTAALFFGKVVGLLLGIVRLNFLARYLGVAGFGILNFATYFCSLFQVLFDFGISQLLTRELARDLSRSRELVGKTVLLKIIIVFISSLLLGIIALTSHFDRVTNWAILLTTLAFAINGISMVFLSAYQAHRKMVLVSITTMMNDLLVSIAIILLIAQFPYVVTALIITALVSFLNLGILFVVYIRLVGMPVMRIDTSLWKALVKESAPIAVSSIGISAYMFAGPTILKYTRGDVEVGVFSSAYKLISILTLIPTAVTQVLYPIFSDFYINAKEKLEKALADSLRVMCLISIPFAVGTVLLAPRIFDVLYPQEFRAGIVVLQVMILAIVTGYMNWIFSSFLLAINEQVFSMRLSLATGVTVFLVSFVLIPRFGLMALPFIAIAAEFILFFPQLWHIGNKGFHSFHITFLTKPLLASLAMAIMLFMIRNLTVFVLIPIGIATYGVSIYVAKGLGEQERSLLRGIYKRAMAPLS